MCKVLACDLDGTLFYPKQRKHYVSKKNVEFLRRFIDDGNKVVLVSSRGEDIIKKVIAEIDRPCDYLAATGSITSIDGEVVRRKHIPNKTAIKIVDEVIKAYKPIGVVVTCEEGPHYVAPTRPVGKYFTWLYGAWYKSFGIYCEDFKFSEEELKKALEEKKILLIKFFCGIMPNKNKLNKELNKKVREEYPEIEASWLGVAIELSSKGCSKAEAISYYAKKIGADLKDVIVIGDSGNDISMFNKFHENSYCMSHAYPSVKKYAKHEVSRVYKLEKYIYPKED